jgi:hypothetical protein
MAQRMFREYETAREVDILDFSDLIAGVHAYVKFWPTDRVASDENNSEYLFHDELDSEKEDH